MSKIKYPIFPLILCVGLICISYSHHTSNTTRAFSHNKNIGTHALISTMPKSGTLYMQYFFWTLSKKLEDPNFDISQYRFTNSSVKNDFYYKDTHLKIGHANCPGYQDTEKDPYKKLWRLKKPWTNGYSWLNESLSEKFDPTKNPQARIVYIFRNPLDQAVSMYSHTKSHVDEGHRKASQLPLRDFLLKLSAIDTYIKQYHTFKVMQRLYPDQILLISYEDLVRKPQRTFMKICHFLKILDITKENQALVNSTVSSSSKENLRKIEIQIGSPLAKDQIPTPKKTHTHIRSGKVGRWKGKFTQKDLDEVDRRLKEFGYNLSDFTIN